MLTIKYSSVPNLYSKKLIEAGVLTTNEAETISKSYTESLNVELASIDAYQPEKYYLNRQWKNLEQAPSAITYWDTGLDYDLLRYIGQQSVHIPENFVS